MRPIISRRSNESRVPPLMMRLLGHPGIAVCGAALLTTFTFALQPGRRATTEPAALHLGSVSSSRAGESASSSSAGQSKAPPRRIETELITCGRHGFEPTEIVRPKGPFFLTISNRATVEELALYLRRDQGTGLREVRMQRGRQRWSEAFDLLPGRYVVTEANHPAWVCYITVTPN